MTKDTHNTIISLMRSRILILDGATGTYLQKLGLTEDDFRGSIFREHTTPLKGCNDVLCLTQPDAIRNMHLDYIGAGADIIETNSFNCNCFSLADYGLQDRVYEISKAAAGVASSAARATTARRIFVAGSMGPTNRTASMSADVNNPAQRSVTFSQLVETYTDCVNGLLDGGADIILVETIFDTLNAKAALKAIDEVAAERGTDIPVMCSGTLADASGRTLSGQTVEAYVASLTHARLISIGLNCAFGARQLRPWLERLAMAAPCPVSVHPNAGLPNVMGGYDETPNTFAQAARDFMSAGLVNIYGGCCGTTPAHIRAVAEIAGEYAPRPIPELPECGYRHTVLSGLEPLTITPESGFINVGERTNVAGSAKFRKLIQEGNYEDALSIARAQVESGAQIIDVCMDDGMIDGVQAMTHFLNLVASEPQIASVPVMIDSSKWEILQAGLQCVQGKSIVNSISLKEGEEKFLQKARYIHAMGAATVVMLFDEEGQADTYERKVQVARRAFKLLQSIGFPPEDIIFDPNVLAVATGMPEHDDYGRAFIEACRTIRQEMPMVHLSGGISNLSFSFRGNNPVRQAMHSVFLYHAMNAGLDMSIVNPAMLQIYSDIPADLLKATEDVILNTDPEASERLIGFAQKLKEESDALKAAQAGGAAAPAAANTAAWRTEDTKGRIAHAMLNGITDFIEEDSMTAYHEAGTPLAVIDNYLMPAMENVGKLFGEGKMFLPQVVKSARVMKKAVAVLEPYMQAQQAIGNEDSDQGRILMATVKGDVHDIGKNIVSVVTQCNGYQVRDLGVMVDPITIVESAQQWNASVIGLSGLITPSLDEMIHVVRELQKRGMTTPVIVGGATTSALHTAVKMAPEYPSGVVLHSMSAADNSSIIRRLLAQDSKEYIAEMKSQQKILRDTFNSREKDKNLLTIEESRERRFVKEQELVAVPRSTEQVIMSSQQPAGHSSYVKVSISDLAGRMDWTMFLSAWGLKGHFPEILSDPERGAEATKVYNDAQALLLQMEQQNLITLQATARILPARSNDSDCIVITADGKEYTLPFPRSLKPEEQTHCLADHIMRGYRARKLTACPCCQNQHATDFICPFVVTAGPGVRKLQEQFRADADEYHAIMAKLLADRLAEALAQHLQEHMQTHLFWGTSGIRMAFGYGACPDHSLKIPVLDMLRARDFMDIELTETNMINPGESICGLIFANTPLNYFNV